MACVPHALVVPARGQGHVTPCMLLARALAELGFQVSFVYFSSEYAKKRLIVEPHLMPHTEEEGHSSSHTTSSDIGSGSGSGGSGSKSDGEGPANVATSRRTGSQNDRGLIHIHVVEDEIPPAHIDNPFFVTPAMKENLFNLILELREQGTPLTCLITDPFAPWTVHVADRAGLPLVNFWSSTALAFVLIYDISFLFSQGIFPEKGSTQRTWKRETPLMLDHIPGLPPISSELYPRELRFGDASNPLVSVIKEVFSCAKQGERMLIHSMSELEPDALHVFQAVGIPAYAVGPLLHYTKKQESSSASSQAKGILGQLGALQLGERTDCISWLNTQVEASVIYIAFGSIVSLPVEDIQELALGLEASGNPFLWVIRENSHGGAGLAQVLPDGFLDRMSGKGMIISWAPQVEVLGHKAIGGFLTHCGWNSTLESLWEGVPMLCCPCIVEQVSNSHCICNVWGVGLELGRTDAGGLERRFVELGVRGLMQEEEGLRARGKAQEVMQLARKTCQPGGQSYSNLQKFYHDMKELCCKPSSS